MHSNNYTCGKAGSLQEQKPVLMTAVADMEAHFKLTEI